MSKPTTKLTEQFSLQYIFLTESQWFYKPQMTLHYLNYYYYYYYHYHHHHCLLYAG